MVNAESNRVSGAAPLLFRHATPRAASPTGDLPGHYDSAAQLWVIETASGLVPVIQADPSTDLETSTSTRVRQEGDDEDMPNMAATTRIKEADGTNRTPAMRALDVLLDTNTLTEVRPEADDTDFSTGETLMTPRHLGSLAELVTKTDVQQESDDQMRGGAMLGLETRTLNNQGGVDHTFDNMLLDLQTKTFMDVESDDESSLIH